MQLELRQFRREFRKHGGFVLEVRHSLGRGDPARREPDIRLEDGALRLYYKVVADERDDLPSILKYVANWWDMLSTELEGPMGLI